MSLAARFRGLLSLWSVILWHGGWHDSEGGRCPGLSYMNANC